MMNSAPQIDYEKKTAIVEPGLTITQFHLILAQHGLALSIVGSISDESVGGIIATATHGSGADFPCMAEYVLSIELLLASGVCVRCSRTENKDLFLATVGGLGATGIVVSATLLLETAFRLKDVQGMVPFEEVVNNLEDIARSAEHARFWWFVATDTIRTSRPNRTNEVIDY
jgi:L-gulonolactone oxidase